MIECVLWIGMFIIAPATTICVFTGVWLGRILTARI